MDPGDCLFSGMGGQFTSESLNRTVFGLFALSSPDELSTCEKAISSLCTSTRLEALLGWNMA